MATFVPLIASATLFVSLSSMTALPVAAQVTSPLPRSEASSQDATETETVHILVGRSIIVNMQARLRKVYLSNPIVIESATTSPTQVVVTAKAPGSSNVVFWDETGHERMLEVFADIDINGFREALGQEYPDQHIDARAEEGRIILTGIVADKEIADNAGKMASIYAKDVVNALAVSTPPHGKQIMLRVRFAEVDRSKLTAFGMNILSTGAANTPGVISTQQFGSPGLNGNLTSSIGAPTTGTSSSFSVNDLLNVFLFRPDLNLGITLKDLQQRNVLQLLAEPNLLAVNGETAHFLAGGEFPYPVVQGSVGGTVGAVTIQFRPYGVKLDFTGNIEPDGTIRLKVAPEVSSLDYSNAVTISGFTVPALSTRRAETAVELKDGQSFGIAGLLNSSTILQMSKIPGVADIPILGQLFHSHSKNFQDSELLVLVTPSIVDPLGSNAPVPEAPKPVVNPLDRQEFDRHFHSGGAPATGAPTTGK